MKVYLDLVFLLNFCYDLLLLMTIDITLKRHMNIKRLLIASIVGALSLGILFLPFNKVVLFILKILVSVLMILIAFKYKNGENVLYLIKYDIEVSKDLSAKVLNVETNYDNVEQEITINEIK